MSNESDDQRGRASARPLLGPEALLLADHSTERALNVLADAALETSGHVTRLTNAVASGKPAEIAIKEVLPLARGIVAEETLVAVYNRDAGLVGSPALASRFEVSNDPLRDVVVRADDKTLLEVQAKFGQAEYVASSVRSGKYPGKIVTSEEVVAELAQSEIASGVTDTIRAARVTTDSISDADVFARAKEILERRIKKIAGMSSWDAVGKRLKESAPAGLGAAVIAGVAETWRAAESGEPIKADRVFRASLKSAARAMATDQVGRAIMQWLERQVLKTGTWTQAAIKEVSSFASPAAAMASFIVDLVANAWNFVNDKISGEEFWRRLVGSAGAALLGCLGASLGYFLGSFFGPFVAVLLAIAGGALGTYYGETAGLALFDAVKGTPTPVPEGA